jgi:hypothetical protein
MHLDTSMNKNSNDFYSHHMKIEGAPTRSSFQVSEETAFSGKTMSDHIKQ